MCMKEEPERAYTLYLHINKTNCVYTTINMYIYIYRERERQTHTTYGHGLSLERKSALLSVGTVTMTAKL